MARVEDASRKKPSRPVDPVVVKRQRGALADDVAQSVREMMLKTAQPGGPPAFDDADAYSVEEFCRRHRISIQLFYKFKSEMPATINVGKRVLITREAAARWRAAREAEAATTGA